MPDQTRLESAAAMAVMVVCLGEPDAVAAARRAAAHLQNVMFNPAVPAEIPWQEGFFSWVVAEAENYSSAELAEIARVLSPEGRLWLPNFSAVFFLDHGWEYRGDYVRKPGAPSGLRILRGT